VTRKLSELSLFSCAAIRCLSEAIPDIRFIPAFCSARYVVVVVVVVGGHGLRGNILPMVGFNPHKKNKNNYKI
jgi:hypothetical protein